MLWEALLWHDLAHRFYERSGGLSPLPGLFILMIMIMIIISATSVAFSS
jgi:hypothetical protein